MTAAEQRMIRITSRQQDQTVSQQVVADRYVKGTAEYYRYREPGPDMGHTMTTLRLTPDEIRIVRHGDVESEQSFIPGVQKAFGYRTAQLALELMVVTKHVSVQLENGIGRASWSYDLLMSGDFAGFYELELQFDRPSSDCFCETPGPS
jgi:uncharacterized beta-barrel protein YwiB (DUF1934 family)